MKEPNLVATVNELRKAAYDPWDGDKLSHLIHVCQAATLPGRAGFPNRKIDDLLDVLNKAPKESRGDFLLYLRTTILHGDSRDAEVACLALRVFEPNIEKANALLLRGEM